MANNPRHSTVLIKNLEDQMERLVQQLADLEEFKSSMSTDEFEDTKRDTLEQIIEFKASIDNFKDGDVSAMDDISRMRATVRAAISEAFQTPEVIRMFARNQPALLRGHYEDIRRDARLGVIPKDQAVARMGEILSALKELGEKLTSEEESTLSAYRLGGGHFTASSNSVSDVVLGDVKSGLQQK